MQYETVVYEVKNNIVTIKLNRPEVLNAINSQMIKDLLAALKAAEVEQDSKVLVLKGEGRAFCAGADLNEETKVRPSAFEYRADSMSEITRVMVRMGKVVIAAVHGYAIGAGFEWAMNADLRIAAEGAKFGTTETNVGSTISNAGTKLLTYYVGLGRAKELYFTNEFMDAGEAHRYGLVNKLVPLNELDNAVKTMADRINRNSGLSLMLTKQSINRSLGMTIEETLAMETRDHQVSVLSPLQHNFIVSANERLKSKKK